MISLEARFAGGSVSFYTNNLRWAMPQLIGPLTDKILRSAFTAALIAYHAVPVSPDTDQLIWGPPGGSGPNWLLPSNPSAGPRKPWMSALPYMEQDLCGLILLIRSHMSPSGRIYASGFGGDRAFYQRISLTAGVPVTPIA